MNEFTAKKLGEVLAFAQVGEESFNKGKAGFGQIFNDLLLVSEMNKKQAEEITALAQKFGVAEAVAAKALKTGEKLRAMRELYLKADDWEDPAELMEWSGFFEGAAVIHWNLVSGAAEGLEADDLKALAERGASFHKGLLERIGEQVKAHGKKKAGGEING